MEYSCSIRFVVALEAEAEPIIKDYDLKEFMKLTYLEFIEIIREVTG